MKTYKQNGWDVPVGFALVPVEPTPMMVEAAVYRGEDACDSFIYKDMIVAAPQPPAKPEVGAEPVTWSDAQRVAAMPGVDKELRAFSLNSNRYNAACLVEAVLDARPANPPDAQAIRDEGVKAMAEAVALLNIGIRALKKGGAA